MSTPNQPPQGPPGSQPPLPPPAGPRASGAPQPPLPGQQPPASTSRMPAQPPATVPGGSGGGAPPAGPRPAAGRPAPAPDDKSKTWKIATIVLALTTVAALVWGFMATRNANDTQAQMQAEIDQLKTQMSSEESTAAKRAREAEAELRKYRAQVASLKGSLRVDTKDLRQEGRELKRLRARYEAAQQAASQEEATLNDRLTAANSKAALAQHCASVMAAGLTRIYEDVPDIVTYREVANVIGHAQTECQGIVTIRK